MKKNSQQHLKLYPDVVANAGMLNWARNLLVQNPTIVVSGGEMNFVHFRLGTRSAQIFLGAEVRQFVFNLWEAGNVLADGRLEDFESTVEVVKCWVMTVKSAESLERENSFVKARSNHPKPKVKSGTFIVSDGSLRKL